MCIVLCCPLLAEYVFTYPTVRLFQQGNRYRVKFDSPRVTANKNRVVSGAEVAYPEQSTVRLHVGVRVVAAFRHTQQQTPTFYSGTIAEAPKVMNGYRYGSVGGGGRSYLEEEGRGEM